MENRENTPQEESERTASRKELRAAREAERSAQVEQPAEGKKKTAESKRRAATRHKSSRKRHRKEKIAWWRTPVLCVCTCILAGVIVFTGGALHRWNNFRTASAQLLTDQFYSGITVDGEDVSGMSLPEALDIWKAKEEAAKEACDVTLDIDNKRFTFNAQNLGFSTNYEEVLNTAYSQGRYGTFSQRSDTLEKLQGDWARDYSVHSGIDEEKLEAALAQIADQVNEPAIEATITGFSETDGFTFDSGKDGKVVDVHELKDAVLAQIQAGGGVCSVARKVVTGGRTITDLRSMFGMIFEFRTNARTSSDNRLTNLRIATRTLNGMRIEPGETFSFNATLGQRTRDKGYKGAPALSSGTHTFALGGGICQVASTLFNAVARSGLEIVERHPHSLPSTYIAIGLDATVNWPNQDFKFKNTSDYPIYIAAKVNASKQVVVAIYGRLLEEGMEIRLKGVVNEKFRPKAAKIAYTTSLPTGEKKWIEERYKGYKATTYRGYFKNGQEIKREVLFTSIYPASAGKCLIGK